MIVGSTPYRQAINIYAKAALNNRNIHPVQSTQKASGSRAEVFFDQADNNIPEKRSGIISQNKKNASPAEKQQKQQEDLNEKIAISKMLKVERQVTAHEQAHKAAAGQYAGPISYDYATGPDGKKYVISGNVPINAPQGRTPEETIKIMERVKRAALAPADPSAQDVSVATQAAQIESAARAELSKKSAENVEYQEDYITSFPLKGKITEVSDYNPYSQPIEDVEDHVKKTQDNNKKKLGLLEEMTSLRRSQINQASMNLASQTTMVNQETNRSTNNLLSYEKYKEMVQQQSDYSGRMYRILDIVA